MARAKRGWKSRQRHKKVLKLAKGNYGARGKLFRVARHTVERGLKYAFRDRRNNKRDFRKLWIARINAGARAVGLSYSRFIAGLKRANVAIDRKILADLAALDPKGFGAVADIAKAA